MKPTIQIRKIKDFILQHCSAESLLTLCHDLKVDSRALPRESEEVLVQALLLRLDSEERIHQLLAHLLTLQPRLFLNSMLHLDLLEQAKYLMTRGVQYWQYSPEDLPPEYQSYFQDAKAALSLLQRHYPDYVERKLPGILEELRRELGLEHAAQLLDLFVDLLPKQSDLARLADANKATARLRADVSRLVAAGKVAEARQAYLAFRARYLEVPEPGDVSAHFAEPEQILQQLQVYLDAARWEDALAAADRLAERFPAYPDPRGLAPQIEKPRAMLAAARTALEQGRSAEVHELAARLEVYKSFPGVQKFCAQVERLRTRIDQAQACAEAQRWSEACTLFAQVAAEQPAYRDAAARHAQLRRCLDCYQRAQELRNSPQKAQWELAAEVAQQALAALPAHEPSRQLLESLRRSRELYASAETALLSREYEPAREALETLLGAQPSYPGAAELLARLSAWNQLYEAARGCLSGRNFGGAQEKLEQLEQDCPDFRQVRVVRRELDQLHAVLEALQLGPVRDPLAPQVRCDPYLVLAAHGIALHPSTAFTAVLDALAGANRGGSADDHAAARHAWEEIRHVEQRLKVDAFFYTVHQAAPLANFLCEFMAGEHRLPHTDQLVAAFPEDAPVVLLLLGRRGEALERWSARQREQPRSGAIAWALALCHLMMALDAEEQAELEAAIDHWEQAVAQSEIALSDTAHWREWCMDRGRVYGRPVLATQAIALREGLHELFRQPLRAASQAHERAGRTDAATRYQDLLLDSYIERRAVALLKESGGVADDATRKQHWYGPLLLKRQKTGRPLANLVASMSTNAGDPVAGLLTGRDSPEVARRLRLLFSSLRYAAVLAEDLGNQQRAMERLKRLDCGRCPPSCENSDCTLHGSAELPFAVCCPGCPEFLERNPVYALLQNPLRQFLDDALILLVASHHRYAAELLGSEPGDRSEEAIAHLGSALSCADKYRYGSSLRENLVQTILEHVRKGQQQFNATRKVEILHRSIKLLRFLKATNPTDPSLATTLSEHLTMRSGCYTQVRDYEAAIQDAEEALVLTSQPTILVRDGCAVTIAWYAHRQSSQDCEHGLMLLQRAETLIRDGQALYPDYEEFDRTLRLIEDIRAAILKVEHRSQEISALLLPSLAASPAELQWAKAQEERDSGKQQSALTTAMQAYGQTQENDPLREDIRTFIETLLPEVLNDSQRACTGEEAERLLEQTVALIYPPAQRQQRGEILRWFCLMCQGLQSQLKYTMSGLQLSTNFVAHAIGSVSVRMAIEDSCLLSISTRLFSSGKDDELFIEDLLQASSDLMLIKIGGTSSQDACLVSQVYLGRHSFSTAAELGALTNHLVRQSAAIADVRPEVLDDITELRTHIRSVLARSPDNPFRNHRRPPELKPLQEYVRANHPDWTWEELNELRAEITTPAVPGNTCAVYQAQIDGMGLRLATDLGYLPSSGGSRMEVLSRVLRANSGLGPGKLVLAPDGLLRLLAEIPSRDYQEALPTLFLTVTANRARLSQELVQTGLRRKDHR